MKNLDKKLLKSFITKSQKLLRGDWIIIGGTVLPSMGYDHRFTTDIDFINLNPASNNDSLILMDIAHELGLPVESINQAGAFFLKKIPQHKDHLVMLAKGDNSQIFRPNLYLYTKLKISRLSESDLSDLLAFIEVTKNENSKDLIKLTKKLIDTEIKKNLDKEKKNRLNELLSKIAAS